MNSLTTAENQRKLSEREIELGTVGTKNSWHNIYKDSAWIFVGGLPFDLTEGDVICIFSQYGEIVNINMVRDKKTGKTKGFAFICYEDQRSTILAVDNFNTTKILQRTIRVDHVKDYRPPDQDDKNADDVTKIVRAEGVAPRPLTPSASDSDDFLLSTEGSKAVKKKKKKEKKLKKEKKVKKEKMDPSEGSRVKREAVDLSPTEQRGGGSRHARNRSERDRSPLDVKTERFDPSYNKYANRGDERVDKNKTADKRNGEVKTEPSKKGSRYRGDESPERRRRQPSPSRRSPALHSSERNRHRSSPEHRPGSTRRTPPRDRGQGSRSRRSPLRDDRRSRSPTNARHSPPSRRRSSPRERRRSRSPHRRV